MGFLIVCRDVTFKEENIIPNGKVEIPEVECDHAYDNECDTTCNLCGTVRTAPHNYIDGFCSVCGKRSPDNPYTIAEYPVTDTLKGLYDFGGTEETSLVNYAPNSTAVPNVVVNGSWELADNYAIFSGASNASRIDTNIILPLENGVTFVALFRVPTGSRPLIGNRRTGFGLDLLNSAAYLYADGATNPQTFDTPINSNNFAILAMTASTDGYRVVRYTNNALTPWDDYDGGIDVWNNTLAANALKVGGDGSSNSFDDAHISLAAIHEGEMDDSKLLEVCKFVKEYGEQKGLTIE